MISASFRILPPTCLNTLANHTGLPDEIVTQFQALNFRLCLQENEGADGFLLLDQRQMISGGDNPPTFRIVSMSFASSLEQTLAAGSLNYRRDEIEKTIQRLREAGLGSIDIPLAYFDLVLQLHHQSRLGEVDVSLWQVDQNDESKDQAVALEDMLKALIPDKFKFIGQVRIRTVGGNRLSVRATLSYDHAIVNGVSLLKSLGFSQQCGYAEFAPP